MLCVRAHQHMDSSPATDVAVVGAGPAGCIASLLLARVGVRVRLFDRARFPRHKLCGDTINPGAMAILGRLGLSAVTDGALPVAGMIVTDESGVRCQGRYQEGRCGRALRRSTLDASLLAAAAKAGVEIEEGVLVREPLVYGGRVCGIAVAGRSGGSLRIEAPIVVAADGASSRLARALNLALHRSQGRRWAVGAYFEGVADVDDSPVFGEMHIRRDRYIGIAPMPGGITNACVVTADRTRLAQPRQLLCDSLRRDPILVRRFERATMVTAPVCLGPLAVECSSGGAPGLLLAGDAAGFIDPMTGDGLRFAFRGAELAASMALAALRDGWRDAHHDLDRVRRREFGGKWRFNRALRALVGSPSAMRVAAAGAQWSPALLERVIQHAGDARG